MGVVEVLPSYQYIDFRELVTSCKVVKLLTISGTKAGFLGDSRVRDVLADLHRKSHVTILLANPFSEAITTRYQHDEPDTYEAGPDGIERRLLALYRIISELPSNARSAMEVRVYDSYPTISIIQGDNDLYSITYGYKLRGGDCPKVHSKPTFRTLRIE